MSEASGDFRVLALRAWNFAMGEPLPCVACGSQGPWQLHHYEYKSHGGQDEPGNLVPLCGPCHDALHAKLFSLMWTGTVVYRMEGGEITARTPWPPHRGIRELTGDAVHTAKVALDHIEGYVDHHIAPDLSDTAIEVRSINEISGRVLARIAWTRLQMAPAKHRVEAAIGIAAEWSSKGRPVHEGTVRSLANQWELLQGIPTEVWESTPRSIRAYAARRGATPDDAAQIVNDWHDRPGGQGVHDFIVSRGLQACATCHGRRTIIVEEKPCPECGEEETP